MMVVVVVVVRLGWGGAWTAWEYLLPPVPSKVTPSYLFGFPRPSSSSRHDTGDEDYAEDDVDNGHDDVDDYLVDNDEVKLHPNSRSLKRLAQSLAMNMNMMMLLIIITMVLRVLIKYTKK